MENHSADNRSLNATCLSAEPHGCDIKDHLVHYLGCIKIQDQERFFEDDHDIWEEEIEHQIKNLGNTPEKARELTGRKRKSWKEDCESELRRIEFLRNTLFQDEEDKHLVDNLNRSLGVWRKHKGQRPRRRVSVAAADYIPEKDIRVPLIQFENGEGVDLKEKRNWVWSKFPNQKTSLSDLLDQEDNLLLEQHTSDGRLGYYHIPSNNMIWAERVIGRYFGEGRPDYRGIQRELKRQNKTQTYMILRERYWYSQLDGSQEHSPPHARHMRPLCETVSSDPKDADYFPKNMVTFMPYLHWDTSRKREQFATEIHNCHKAGKDRISTMKGLLKEMNLAREKPPMDDRGRVIVVHPLAQLLLDAARLFEGMSNYRDKRLVRDYLGKDPPLHPRRTLDQAYHWTLNSTRKRDRDQVVYRGTTTKPEDFHKYHLQNGWEDHKEFKPGERCQECDRNIKKLSRVVMVDQLWMWILDGKTIITCFPKRYGANKQDTSAIHKSIRVRLQNSGPDQIRTVFDLALIIINECSNTFFDRTKAVDRQPQVIDAFSKAIGNIMHKQTAAFERLWRWTDDASKVYRSTANGDTSELHVPLLDIYPEGRIEREIKDIIEELDIMLHITKTQKKILTKFIANAENILDPFGKFGDSKKREMTGRHLWNKAKDKPKDLEVLYNNEVENPILNNRRDDYDWFKHNADERLDEVVGRIEELEELRASAIDTAQSVKDLLELKQQQASVVQAWQAVKQSEETIRQGRSIMMFTLVTIVFLPLSFMSSVFGMNNIEITSDTWSINTEFVYMFSISAGVIIFSLVIAFGSWIRAGLFYLSKWMMTEFLVRFGLYNMWLDSGLSSKVLYRNIIDWSDRRKRNSRNAHLEHKREKAQCKNGSDTSEKVHNNSSGDSDNSSGFMPTNGSLPVREPRAASSNGDTNGHSQAAKMQEVWQSWMHRMKSRRRPGIAINGDSV
ncbi:uncharacterized protein F4822DRAFT_351390 [Hypoxylon trugodes]|uniref:uncharacterized protein n=1 Tax=Hypoxylon trugodes TaxID=326681 RepID=UPI0021A12447|nr:uncharacterized protein F4822DRAFT_351390 [Hypoxylon trugodes]KAI1385692.1 hypothetical protein F4822DRAFT_351390 [Hypoxylon trugodes]